MFSSISGVRCAAIQFHLIGVKNMFLRLIGGFGGLTPPPIQPLIAERLRYDTAVDLNSRVGHSTTRPLSWSERPSFPQLQPSVLILGKVRSLKLPRPIIRRPCDQSDVGNVLTRLPAPPKTTATGVSESVRHQRLVFSFPMIHWDNLLCYIYTGLRNLDLLVQNLQVHDLLCKS